MYSSWKTDSKKYFVKTFPHILYDFDWFPTRFFMSLHLSRMVSSIASPAMLGRSYALLLRMHLQSFGDLTLVKKHGNGPWRWLAQRVLFGAYQVSWWEIHNGCWMIDDWWMCFFFWFGWWVMMMGVKISDVSHLDSDVSKWRQPPKTYRNPTFSEGAWSDQNQKRYVTFWGFCFETPLDVPSFWIN